MSYDKIKLIRMNINCTYEEARRALLQGQGSVVQAIKIIEQKYNRKAL